MWISVFFVRGTAEWNALMVLPLRDDLMAFRRLRVQRDALSAVTHFYITAPFAHPYLFAGIPPRHRIAAPLPGHVCVTRHLPLLVVAVRIRRASVDWL